MPGLINKSKWSALPLSVSDITSCVRGYTLAMTASLTYENIEDHPVEGIFIYPLDEFSVVVGFEAMIGSQIITVQVKDKMKIDDCYFDCCNANGTPQSRGGHIVLDEDQETTVLVVSLGVIPPLETINILVSTSSELSTLPNGGIRVSSPPVCSPRVQRSVKEEQAFSPSTARRRDQHHCAVGTHEQTASGVCLAALLEEETINSIDYEFNFHLEIRGPYLLAGVESPSHAIRADAEPTARSATSIVVTLADKYTYDCPVEILIYPSEPHLPHVLIEDGDMTPEEYDEHLKRRNDYIKATKKDCSNEKTVDIIRKRLHKDILHNPVAMLNFCPDLRSTTSDLRSIQGEYIFFIDRSGSMSGANINRVKVRMLVLLCYTNSGPHSQCLLTFDDILIYSAESLALACEHMKKIRADMGGTNILAPLNWILRQPMQRGHPRLLFLLTDGAVSNTGKVIELLRSHARFTRCYTFGIGQGACRRLVLGLAAVSRGTAEFLAEGERLQPKMIKSLKKSMTSVLTDISIEWLYPETKEILLSPVGATCLFPGDRLIGYSVVCDTSRYHSNPKSDKRRRYSMMRSNESSSSVFYHSQEEDAGKVSSDGQGPHRDNQVSSLRYSMMLSNESASSVFYHSQEEDAGKVSSDGQGPHRDNQVSSLFDGCQETMSESSPVATEQDIMGTDIATSPRRRAYSTNQIVDYNPMKKAYTPSDPSSVVGKNPLRRAKVQELIGQTHPDHGAQWKMDYQPQLASLCATSSRGRPITAHKPPAQQPEGLQGESKVDQTHPGPVVEDGSRSSTDSPSLGSTGDADGYTHQLCEVETPQDPHAPEFKASHGKGDCKAVISGLLCGKPMRWEVAFDIQPYLKGREREEKVHEDLWNETFHHLAGRSIIQDFEHMVDKECEIEHGSGRRYQLYAIHTSKACNILSKYTAFVPIDLDSNEYLPTCIEYSHPGEDHKRSSHCSSRSGSRKNRGYSVGLGRSQSGGLPGQEDAALCYNDSSQAPCKTPSSSSWERCSSSEASQRSPSVTSDPSQRSVESLFSASKLSLSRTRLLTKAARGFMSRSQSKISNSVGESENDNKDYIPLVSLQLSCGAFMLDSALCDAINVPMDKLKWTSPFTSHRLSLTHVSHSGSRRSESLEVHHGSSPPPKDSDFNSEFEEVVSRTSSSSFQARSPRMEGEPSLLSGFSSMSTEAPPSPVNSLYDSGRGSESEITETPLPGSPGILRRAVQDPEGMVWATAVALAWLEHSSASYFIEWEMIAAKASMWLDEQIVPEGRDLASVKATANQLFIILRHWDENLQLNMLCYNPNSV
ncbi:von Willebrand factor A domain-containing protein 5B1-like [Sinocyclocheilus rhinocerous]|uniref:von Willebrand factor A domain-containing protein 5B1-like n=1 Tax=Sinocyclocheilus rhinocerous TaxID=307959 RepID=UPI0007B7E9A3|nr:PREDICTED: von Willebrand factor A domain-containing protein 5B1-like [Sinocyclocheilus rhinocerous]